MRNDIIEQVLFNLTTRSAPLQLSYRRMRQLSQPEQKIRIKQYLTALTIIGLDRSATVDLLRACWCDGRIAFWGGDAKHAVGTDAEYVEGATL